MPLNILTTQTTGKTLFASLERLSDGFFWNVTTSAWANNPAAADRKVTLTEGSGANAGSYTASVSGLGDATDIRARVHDDADAADKTISAAVAYVWGGNEVPKATDASGNALATASSVSALQTIFTGITSLAQWLGLIAGKQVGNSTARTELRATGAGSGTFDEATDSLEAVRDNMAAAAAGVTILPLSATMATDELRNYFLTCGQHAGKTWTLGVYDREENPVNLSGKTVKVAAWRSSSPSTIVVSMIGTVGGVNNNQVAFSITGANTTLAEVYQYRMRNTTDDTDLLEGTITIAPAPDIT